MNLSADAGAARALQSATSRLVVDQWGESIASNESEWLAAFPPTSRPAPRRGPWCEFGGPKVL